MVIFVLWVSNLEILAVCLCSRAPSIILVAYRCVIISKTMHFTWKKKHGLKILHPQALSEIVLCLFAYSGVQHILCCVFVCFFFRFVYPMLPVSLDYTFWLPLRYSLTFIYINIPKNIRNFNKYERLNIFLMIFLHTV